MIGSPNYIFIVYDGDESASRRRSSCRRARSQIEDRSRVLHAAWASRTTTPSSAAAATTRRSSNNGIPSGGLFTGAEVVKTAEQPAIWGGTAGEQFDPCYHQACDDIDNPTCTRSRSTPTPSPGGPHLRRLHRVGQRCVGPRSRATSRSRPRRAPRALAQAAGTTGATTTDIRTTRGARHMAGPTRYVSVMAGFGDRLGAFRRRGGASPIVTQPDAPADDALALDEAIPDFDWRAAPAGH